MFSCRFWSPCSSLPSWLPHRPVPDFWPSPSKTSSSSADPLLMQDSPHNSPHSASAVPLVIIHFFVFKKFPIVCAYMISFVCKAIDEERQGAASQPRASSSYGGNDYVDYGAYTGGNGAFGWYSDHPVGNHGSGGY